MADSRGQGASCVARVRASRKAGTVVAAIGRMRPNALGTACLTAGLTLAGTFGAEAQDRRGKAPRDVTITGCLTARPDGKSYALTVIKAPPLADAARTATSDVKETFTYELVGRPDELRPHVGHVVTAKGRIDSSMDTDAEVASRRTETPPPAASDVKPTVKVEERADIEVRRLTVSSVVSDGKPCPATKP